MYSQRVLLIAIKRWSNGKEVDVRNVSVVIATSFLFPVLRVLFMRPTVPLSRITFIISFLCGLHDTLAFSDLAFTLASVRILRCSDVVTPPVPCVSFLS